MKDFKEYPRDHWVHVLKKTAVEVDPESLSIKPVKLKILSIVVLGQRLNDN